MKTVTYEQIKQLAVELAGRTRDNVPVSEATMLRSFFAAELPDIWNREAWPELSDHFREVTLDDNRCFSLPYRVTVTLAADEDTQGTYTLGADDAYPERYFKAAAGAVPADHYIYYDESAALWKLTAAATVVYDNADLLGAWSSSLGDSPWPTITAESYCNEVLAIIEGGDPRKRNNLSPIPQENWSVLNDRVNVLTTMSKVWAEFQLPAPDLLDDDEVGSDIDAYTLPARFRLPLAFRGAALLLADEDPVRAAQYRGLAETELLKQSAHITRPWWRRK